MMKLMAARTLTVVLFLVAAMFAGALYRIPVSSAQEAEYVLHVLMTGPWCSGNIAPISYSGDYSGVIWPPSDIGPYSSPFTVTLAAGDWVAHTGQLCKFVHWTLDGSETASSSIQVTVDDSHPERTATAYYVSLLPLGEELTAPQDAGIVTSDLVSLRVRVTEVDYGTGTWVGSPGATVTILVDGSQVCSGTSGIDGYYSCDYQLAAVGHTYSWYATASKPGYYPMQDATPPWTFTYQEPVPEYPLGLSFFLMSAPLIYTLIRRRTTALVQQHTRL